MRYIASLADHGALSSTIEFFVDSISEAKAVVERRGVWMTLPGMDGDVLLSDGVSITLFQNYAPFREDDNPQRKYEERYGYAADATHIIDVGPKGGVRVNRNA
jgi:hypothetical protein